MRTPIIETERLILRPLCLADAEEVFANWASDPEVAKFMTWSTHTNVEVTKVWLKDVEQNSTDSDKTYDWGFVRKEDNKLIGSGGLYYKESQEAFDMGYNICDKQTKRLHSRHLVCNAIATKSIHSEAVLT